VVEDMIAAGGTKPAALRIVSVAPSITDSLLTLGLGRFLVGATDRCPIPDTMPEVKRIGPPEGVRRADLESLNPDRVLACGEENSPEQILEWRESGLPLRVSSPRTVREAVADLRDLVLMLPSESALQSIVWLDRAVDWASGSQSGNPIRVFCPRSRIGTVENPSAWEAVGCGSYAGDLLSLCGAGALVAGGTPADHPEVTPEEVIAAEPEVILLPGNPSPLSMEDALSIRRMMPDVPAVREERIYPVDGRMLFWPGTRLGEALRCLPDLLRGSHDGGGV
jgi:ABC-type Fe3+-hydroxamate transport system substrate-binding protein